MSQTEEDIVLEDTDDKDVPSAKPPSTSASAPATSPKSDSVAPVAGLSWADVEERHAWILAQSGPISLRWKANQSVGLLLTGISPNLQNLMIVRQKNGAQKIFSDPTQAAAALYVEHDQEVPENLDGFTDLVAQVKEDPGKDEVRWVSLKMMLPAGVRENPPEPPASLKAHANDLQNLAWPAQTVQPATSSDKKKTSAANGEAPKRKRAPAKKKGSDTADSTPSAPAPTAISNGVNGGKEEPSDSAKKTKAPAGSSTTAKPKKAKQPSSVPSTPPEENSEAGDEDTEEINPSHDRKRLQLVYFALSGDVALISALTKYCKMLLEQQEVLQESSADEGEAASEEEPKEPEKKKQKKQKTSSSGASGGGEAKKSKSKSKKQADSTQDTIEVSV